MHTYLPKTLGVLHRIDDRVRVNIVHALNIHHQMSSIGALKRVMTERLRGVPVIIRIPNVAVVLLVLALQEAFDAETRLPWAFMELNHEHLHDVNFFRRALLIVVFGVQFRQHLDADVGFDHVPVAAVIGGFRVAVLQCRMNIGMYVILKIKSKYHLAT